ncbi:MAG: MarR family transcriptional regulator [Deltaproteobacteria bacterium]|nr:MarR family transcriptional regulator [Deltaproteobacteria bacterium]
MRLIWGLGHLLERTSKRMKASKGLTGPQRLVIRLVGRFPGIPPGRLAELMLVHPSTLSGVLRRLERKKLLERRRDPNDARRSLLGLTAAGRALDSPSPFTVEAAVERVLAGSHPSHVESAKAILSRVVQTLGEVD